MNNNNSVRATSPFQGQEGRLHSFISSYQNQPIVGPPTLPVSAHQAPLSLSPAQLSLESHPQWLFQQATYLPPRAVTPSNASTSSQPVSAEAQGFPPPSDLSLNPEQQSVELPSTEVVPRKRGRKPIPGAATRRKEQNRQAQKTFREKREAFLRDLESTAASAHENYGQIFDLMHSLLHQNNSLRAEIWQGPAALTSYFQSPSMTRLYETYQAEQSDSRESGTAHELGESTSGSTMGFAGDSPESNYSLNNSAISFSARPSTSSMPSIQYDSSIDLNTSFMPTLSGGYTGL